MNYENVFLPSVERVKSLVERQYGCRFEFHPVTALLQTEDAALRTNLSAGEPVTAGDWIFFPIMHTGELAGTAKVSTAENLTSDEILKLNTVIRTILEGSLLSVDRLDAMDDIESSLQEKPETHKVIPIRSFQPNPFPVVTATGDDRNILNFSFLIESPSSEDIFKMGLEIHHRANRYAFLNFNDLSTDAIETPDAFKSIGRATIFIQDVTQLSAEQQNKLLAYFMSVRDRECPQIIAGSSIDVTTLRKNEVIHPELLSYLMTGYLRLTAPFSHYKKGDLIQFFFEQMTGRYS